MLGRDRRQRRRRIAAVGAAGVAVKKHHDAKLADEKEAAPAGAVEESEPALSGGGPTPEVLDELKQLGELHEQNVLSGEEFEAAKAKLLGPAS